MVESKKGWHLKSDPVIGLAGWRDLVDEVHLPGRGRHYRGESGPDYHIDASLDPVGPAGNALKADFLAEIRTEGDLRGIGGRATSLSRRQTNGDNHRARNLRSKTVGNRDREPRGDLRITAPVTFGQWHVVPAVTGLVSRFPGVRAELVLLDRVVNLPVAFFRKYSSGDLADRIVSLNLIRTLMSSILSLALLVGFAGFFNGIAMFLYDARLGAIGLLLLVVAAGIDEATDLVQQGRHLEDQAVARR